MSPAGGGGGDRAGAERGKVSVTFPRPRAACQAPLSRACGRCGRRRCPSPSREASSRVSCVCWPGTGAARWPRIFPRRPWPWPAARGACRQTRSLGLLPAPRARAGGLGFREESRPGGSAPRVLCATVLDWLRARRTGVTSPAPCLRLGGRRARESVALVPLASPSLVCERDPVGGVSVKRGGGLGAAGSCPPGPVPRLPAKALSPAVGAA